MFFAACCLKSRGAALDRRMLLQEHSLCVYFANVQSIILMLNGRLNKDELETNVPICIGRGLEFLLAAFSRTAPESSCCLTKPHAVSVFSLKFALFPVGLLITAD